MAHGTMDAGKRESEVSAGGVESLAQFALLGKGAMAPWWLFKGVCDAWNLSPFTTELMLLAVSENVTFLLKVDERPYGVVRVSQPDYVGGPVAVASEIAWVTSLHMLEGASLVDPMPTASGFKVAEIADEQGTQWICVCMGFIEGTPLDEVPDPSSYYRTVGRWAALFHRQVQFWEPPSGFQRFTWDIPDMVGPHARWGNWETAVSDALDRALLKQAEQEALNVVANLPKTPETWGLIHAGLHPSNIILGTDGELTLIDFDDCGFSWFLYDFASALSFVEHEPYAPTMARAWVDGYREVIEFSEADKEMACALSMIRRLQMLGWIAGHFASSLPPDVRAAQVPGTLYCAKLYLSDPLWLLEG